MNWEAIRAQFPATQGQVYLDSASYGPGSERVAAKVTEAVNEWTGGRGSWAAWERKGEDARNAFAALLGVEAESIALLPALSVAAGQIAENLDIKKGGNLVIGDGEFRSNYLPWAQQANRGLEVRVVPLRDHALELEDIDAAIDDETQLVAISAVQSATGFRAPLEEIAAMAHARGARLFVDATQAVGAVRLPVECIDYLGTAAYKWLLGPRGGAFLYVRPELVKEQRPIAANWKSPVEPYTDFYGDADLSDTARRLDVSLSWIVWVGLAEALAMLGELGMEAVERRNLALAERFRAGLASVGLAPLFSQERTAQIVSLRLDDPEAVQRRLAEARVVASVRNGLLRTGFHFYNNDDDVDSALATLADVTR